MVPGVNGLPVPIGDAEALTLAMESLIRSPETVAAMGAASREVALERYDVHRINASILAAMGLA